MTTQTRTDIYSPDSGKRGYKTSTAIKDVKPELNLASWNSSDPDKYEHIYGRLPNVKPGSTANIFASGRSNHDLSLVQQKSNHVLPGAYSFDFDLIDYQSKLADGLNASIKVQLNDNLTARTSAVSDFSQLKCISGTLQSPMSYILSDNVHYRSDVLGLKNKFSPRLKLISDWFFDILFDDYAVENVKVPKKSTGGMRRFTSDAQWKIDFAKYIIQPGNLERVLNMVADDDTYGLANDFEMVFARYTQKRAQVDKPGKVRKIFTKEYAMSGGRTGQVVEANKTVVINGVHYHDFSPMRARVIQAYPWTINCIVQLMFNGHLKSLFKRFPKTFSVNTSEQLKTMFDGKFMDFTDVSNFDNSYYEGTFHSMFDRMAEKWDERLVKLVKRVIYAPYFARPLGGPVEKGEWIGDPMDWTQEIYPGNGSGWGGTSVAAKSGKIIETLFIVDSFLHFRSKEDVEKYLRHEYDIFTINNGDDEGTGTHISSLFEKYKDARNNPDLCVYSVESEVGQVYSGFAMVQPDPEKKIYFPQQRLHVAFEKIFTPERGIGTHLRKFWPIGLMERFEQLSTTEEGREALNICTSIWDNSAVGKRCGRLSKIVMDSVRDMDMPTSGFNHDTKQILMNPDSIHYKDVNLANIDGSILDQIYSNIPKQEVNSFVKSRYSGFINYME